jgi:hypothetical protein
MTPPYTVTEVASDWLNCRYKAFLKRKGGAGEPSAYEISLSDLASEHRQRAVEHLARLYEPDGVLLNPSSLSAALRGTYRLILNATCETPYGTAVFDAVERKTAPSQDAGDELVPVRFIPQTRVSRHDRLLAAIDGRLLAEVQRLPVRSARILRRSGISETPRRTISSVASPVMSSESNRTEPEMCALRARVRPMTVSEETDLPEPDSPTTPSVSPRSTV